MTKKLQHPRRHLNPTSPVVDRCAVGTQKVVCECGAGDDNGRNETARDGFEEDVEDRIYEAADRSEIGREILIL